VALARLLNIDN